jgi:hypothetical protein
LFARVFGVRDIIVGFLKAVKANSAAVRAGLDVGMVARMLGVKATRFDRVAGNVSIVA